MGRNKVEFDVEEVEILLDKYVEEYGITSKLTYKEVYIYFNNLIEAEEFHYEKGYIDKSYWRIPGRQGRIIIDDYNEKKFDTTYLDIDYVSTLKSIPQIISDSNKLQKVLKSLEKEYIAGLNNQKKLEERLGVLEDKLKKINYKNYYLESVLFSLSQFDKDQKIRYLMKMQTEFLTNIDTDILNNFNYHIENSINRNREIEELFDDLE